MPKYYDFKVAGYYLYFTSFCVVECMHVHASDRRLTESGSGIQKIKLKRKNWSMIRIIPVLTSEEETPYSLALVAE